MSHYLFFFPLAGLEEDLCAGFFAGFAAGFDGLGAGLAGLNFSTAFACGFAGGAAVRAVRPVGYRADGSGGRFGGGIFGQEPERDFGQGG